MSNVEEKLAKSLTASSTELIPYLPYLLKDLWELGSTPKDIQSLIAKHIRVTRNTKVLDLACGKGAVSVKLAKEFACRVKGIDIMPDFVTFAKSKAQEHGVGEFCEFVVGDINEAVLLEKDYDIVILGAVGDVLGSPVDTVRKLGNTIRPQGYMFIDDAYATGENSEHPSRKAWLELFHNAGLDLIDELSITDDDLEAISAYNQSRILVRANELKAMYPDKANIFDDYIRCQQEECDELGSEITGVTWLLQKREPV